METKMKKEIAKAEEETKLIWKLQEKPSGHVVAELVAQGVIDKEEARSILFREEVKQSDEVEALKEMVVTLQDLVRDLIAQSQLAIPFTKVVEVPRRAQPYWQRYWLNGVGNTTTTTGYNGDTVYTLSIN